MSSLKNVTAMILVGGLGTRLRSVVTDRPKPLALVHERPFLDYLLYQLIEAGIEDVVLCIGYLGEKVVETYGNSFLSLKIRYSQEEIQLGTAGALRRALPLIKSEFVLVMNGDSFCDINLQDFWQWYCSRKSFVSIVLTEVDNTKRYGQVQTDSSGLIKLFKEKGDTEELGWINAGIYLITRELLTSIPLERMVSLEKDIFPIWINLEIYGYQTKNRFIDIGTPETYKQAELVLNELSEI